MIGYVIVPGIGGSDDAHWQTLWGQQWGAAASRISPASWALPDLDDWVGAIGRAAQVFEAQEDDVVLIAHSLGCWAASTWAHRSPDRRPRGVLLIAPPDPTGDAFPAASAPTFVNIAAHRLPCPSVVVASTNDPYCRLEVAENLARIWGSSFQIAGALGHLNSASGLGEWSQGREMLRRLVSG